MWIYVPGCSPSVPVSAGSTLDSVTLSALARSATCKGKLKPAQFYARAWMRATWTTLLSGVTSEPSTLVLGAMRWILSVGGSLANLSASRASVEEPTTSDGYGQLFVTSSKRAEPRLRFSKTSRGLSLPGLETFSGTCPRSGSLRSGVVSERPRSEPRTVETDGSAWPTPTAARYGSSQNGLNGLNGEKRRPSANTPSLWTIARDWKGVPTSMELAVPKRVETWTKGQVWPTPNTRDASAAGRHTTTTGVMHPGTTLTDAARAHSRHHPPERGTDIVVLNPEFVETLMGFRVGWTDCGCWETPSCPSKPRTRGANSSREH